MPLETAIRLKDIEAARERISDATLQTPCVYSESLSRELDCQLYFKAENLQHIGAFKARGALNAVRCLSESEADRGVVTHSSGNHAAALARAAKLCGIEAYVVMPHNSAKTKIEAVRHLGVDPVFCEPGTGAREEKAAEVQAATGATLVHPFDNPNVMAGQGTVGLEILEQVPNVQAVIAPIGGGGLLSGVSMAIASKRPEVELFGAEPEWADDAYRSLQSGSIQAPARFDTVADGLRTSVGELTFPIVQQLVQRIVLVSEQQILSGMRTITERVKLVTEPSGAVAFAALRREAERFRGRTVVVVISGGNLDMGACSLGQH
jgi:threonine dehydratase